jgi:hypothetical protein
VQDPQPNDGALSGFIQLGKLELAHHGSSNSCIHWRIKRAFAQSDLSKNSC